MTRLHFIILFIILIAPGAQADEFLVIKNAKTTSFRSAPAKQLMTAIEYQVYQRYLEALDCGPAAILLNKVFMRRYMQFSSARAPRGAQYIRWLRIYVPGQFVEMSFCMNVLELKAIEFENAEDGSYIGKIYIGDPGKVPIKYNRGWRRRDDLVDRIAMDAARDYIPALLEMARIVHRGDIFEGKTDVEFYLRKRACHLGYDCTSIQEQIQQLVAKLDKKHVATLIEYAKSEKNMVINLLGFDKWP